MKFNCSEMTSLNGYMYQITKMLRLILETSQYTKKIPIFEYQRSLNIKDLDSVLTIWSWENHRFQSIKKATELLL